MVVGKAYDRLRLCLGICIFMFFLLFIAGFLLLNLTIVLAIVGLVGLIVSFITYFAITRIGESSALKQFSIETAIPMVKDPQSPPSIPSVFYANRVPIPFTTITNLFTISPDFLIFTNTYWQAMPSLDRKQIGSAEEHQSQLCFFFTIREVKGYHTFILRYRLPLAAAEEMNFGQLGTRYGKSSPSIISGVEALDVNYVFFSTVESEARALITRIKDCLLRMSAVFPKSCSYVIEEVALKAEVHLTGMYALVRMDCAAAPHISELYPIIRDMQQALN